MNLPPPTLEQINRLHGFLETSPDVKLLDLDAHTAHHFCKGLYARELRIPAGYTVVGKMHASENFFLLVSGTVGLSTPEGMRLVQGPLLAVTKPGDKRVAHALTDVIMFNFHTREDEVEDMEILETRYVVPRKLEQSWLEQANRKALEVLP